jgi:hypothetical protein
MIILLISSSLGCFLFAEEPTGPLLEVTPDVVWCPEDIQSKTLEFGIENVGNGALTDLNYRLTASGGWSLLGSPTERLEQGEKATIQVRCERRNGNLEQGEIIITGSNNQIHGVILNSVTNN